MTTEIEVVSPQLIEATRRRSVLTMTSDEFSRIEAVASMYAASMFNNKAKMGKHDYSLIMFKGYEVGMSPTVAVDYINIIQGKPCISAAGMLALIQASPEVEDIQIVGDATKCAVTIKRKGRTAHTETFTLEMAKAMRTTEYDNGQKQNISLVEKSNWKQMPAVMLKWRAVSACARACCPDIIGGMYTQEEMRDQPDDENKPAKPTQQPALPAPSAHSTQTSESPQVNATNTSVTPEPPKRDEPPKKWWQVHMPAFTKTIFDNGYIAKNTTAELLELFGFKNVAEFDKFATGKEAGAEAERIATSLGAKPSPNGETPTGEIHTAIVYSLKYGKKGDKPCITAQVGEGKFASYWKGRTEFSALVGQAYAQQADIETWEADDKWRQVKALEIGYVLNEKGYLNIVSAKPHQQAPAVQEEAVAPEPPVDNSDFEAMFPVGRQVQEDGSSALPSDIIPF